MIPYTFPSFVQEDGTTACKVKLITDITGLKAWVDYTPIKFVVSAASINTYANEGSQALGVLTDFTDLVNGLDYISVYEDVSATKPWSTDLGGYIPCFADFTLYYFLSENNDKILLENSEFLLLE